jgi:hypothetical protein
VPTTHHHQDDHQWINPHCFLTTSLSLRSRHRRTTFSLAPFISAFSRHPWSTQPTPPAEQKRRRQHETGPDVQGSQSQAPSILLHAASPFPSIAAPASFLPGSPCPHRDSCFVALVWKKQGLVTRYCYLEILLSHDLCSNGTKGVFWLSLKRDLASKWAYGGVGISRGAKGDWEGDGIAGSIRSLLGILADDHRKKWTKSLTLSVAYH